MNGSLNLIRKPHLELSSKANLSSSITGRALLFRVLPRRIAGPPRRIFYSRKGAKTQRNSGPLGLTSGGLGGYATLRAILFFFFILAKPACRQTGRQAAKKSNRSLPAYPPRRTGLFFFLSQRRQDAKKSKCSLTAYRNHDFEST